MLICKVQMKYETGVNMEMWNTFSMYPKYLNYNETISAWHVMIVAMQANVCSKQIIKFKNEQNTISKMSSFWNVLLC